MSNFVNTRRQSSFVSASALKSLIIESIADRDWIMYERREAKSAITATEIAASEVRTCEPTPIRLIR
jgi:hypothetical protein